jgi:hypothetical protein
VLTQLGAGVFGTVAAVAVHTGTRTVIAAENGDAPAGGVLWRSIDGGTTWTDITVPSWETTCTIVKHMIFAGNDLMIAMNAGYSRTAGTDLLPAGRDAIGIGVMPDSSNTGVLPGVARTTTTGDITITVNGTVLQNQTINGKVIVKAANVTIRNCLIQGPNSAVPSSGGSQQFLVSFNDPACVNAQMIDCTLAPQHPFAAFSATNGHDYLAKRCHVYHCVDGFGIYNTTASQPYACNVVLQQNYVHDLAWWTAATTGVVHPSDTHTHNDCVQIQGGTGLQLLGNRFDAQYSRQFAHWQATSITAEPYTSVGLNSLSDGGPFEVLPNRGTGLEADGRYNWLDLSCLMINQSVGASHSIVCMDNWFSGGQFNINGGSDTTYNGTDGFGTFYRNRFGRDQGQRREHHSHDGHP